MLHLKSVEELLLDVSWLTPTGRPDGFYAIDLANEFHNRSVKDVWSNRKTTSTTVGSVSEYGAIDALFLRPLRLRLQAIWGRRSLGKHVRANRGRVIHYIAIQSRRSIMLDPTRSDPDTHKLTWSRDAVLKGAGTIEDTLDSFNAKFMYDSNSLWVVDDIPIWDDDVQEVYDCPGPDVYDVDRALVEALACLPTPTEELLGEVEMGL
jgi:hypothetical protein